MEGAVKGLVAALVAEGGLYLVVAVLLVLLILQGVMAHRDRGAYAKREAELHKAYGQSIHELQEKRFEDHKAILKASTDAIHTNTLTLHTLAETLGRRAS